MVDLFITITIKIFFTCDLNSWELFNNCIVFLF